MTHTGHKSCGGDACSARIRRRTGRVRVVRRGGDIRRRWPSRPRRLSGGDCIDTDDGQLLIVTDAEVADMEKQLDEIDQLLAGVDSDLSQD